MTFANILGDSHPATDARIGDMIEVQGLRMRVQTIAEDQTRVCHDPMAHRYWRIPAQSRVLIVVPR